MYLDDRELFSVSASIVAPTPRPPELDEELEEDELLDELELLEELEEDELLDELELLEELEELELLLEELELFEGLVVVPPQAVRLPMVKHNKPALSSASGLLPERGFVMSITLKSGGS